LLFTETIHAHSSYFPQKIQKKYQGMGVILDFCSKADTLHGQCHPNHHKGLDCELKSFWKCSPQLRGVYLPMGPKGKICINIVTCVLFIIQDMQEQGDGDLKNCDVHCRYLVASDMDVMARIEDDDTRTQWSQHKLDNAFAHIEFADRGIFGTTAVETMQAFWKGVIEKITKLVLESFSIQEGCL
jgi:hypothetical protein